MEKLKEFVLDIKENNYIIFVMAGDPYNVVSYKGFVTDIDDRGFWLTENKEADEYISFLDVGSIEVDSESL